MLPCLLRPGTISTTRLTKSVHAHKQDEAVLMHVSDAVRPSLRCVGVHEGPVASAAAGMIII